MLVNRSHLSALLLCLTLSVGVAVNAQTDSNSRRAYRAIQLSQINPAKLVGTHPATPVFEAFDPLDEQSAQIDLRYPEDRKAIATLVLTGLRDDSVRSSRYRVELVQQGSLQKPQWKIVWAGEQFKCQPGRGQQDWSSKLCR